MHFTLIFNEITLLKIIENFHMYFNKIFKFVYTNMNAFILIFNFNSTIFHYIIVFNISSLHLLILIYTYKIEVTDHD